MKQQRLITNISNNSDNYVVGEAIYNITPFTSSKYFNKLQCFYYNKMIIPPYSNIVLPLVFYIDPDICFDENTKYRQNDINICFK